MIHQVEISSLLINERSLGQSVILREADTDKGRQMAICIGMTEAMAISSILNEEPFPRPLTHTLAGCILKGLGGQLKRVVITDLRSMTLDSGFEQMTYFAELHIRQGDHLIVIDSRPSDALTLALALKAPIFASEKVLNSGVPFTLDG